MDVYQNFYYFKNCNKCNSDNYKNFIINTYHEFGKIYECVCVCYMFNVYIYFPCSISSHIIFTRKVATDQKNVFDRPHVKFMFLLFLLHLFSLYVIFLFSVIIFLILSAPTFQTNEEKKTTHEIRNSKKKNKPNEINK